jgi:hypothetical protein
MRTLTGLSAVRSFLNDTDTLNASTRPLTEREYVERILAFGSGLDLARCYLELTLHQAIDADTDFTSRTNLAGTLAPASTDTAEWLQAIHLGDAPTGRAERLLPLANRMIQRPTYELNANRLTERRHYYPDTLHAALAYGVLLLLDHERGYGRDLCRCRFAECNRFFLAVKPPTGRPRRDYCSQEHFRVARAAKGAARIRAYRAAQKEKTKSGRTARHRRRMK